MKWLHAEGSQIRSRLYLYGRVRPALRGSSRNCAAGGGCRLRTGAGVGRRGAFSIIFTPPSPGSHSIHTTITELSSRYNTYANTHARFTALAACSTQLEAAMLPPEAHASWQTGWAWPWLSQVASGVAWQAATWPLAGFLAEQAASCAEAYLVIRLVAGFRCLKCCTVRAWATAVGPGAAVQGSIES